MEDISPKSILRIYLSSTDKFNLDPMYESIFFQAKKNNLAGATVIKGILGYGASSIIHSNKFWEISDKVPVVIEIIDTAEKIRDFFELIRPQLDAMSYGCLATLENIEVLIYKTGKTKHIKS